MTNWRDVDRGRILAVVRGIGLLVLIVCCLVVPIVSVVSRVFSAPDQGSLLNYCPDPTTPCEAPQVIPTGRP
jgi:hypothetical protein